MDRHLSDYLPDVIKSSRIFGKLTDAEQPEIERLWQQLHDALLDGFVADATENGVMRYEKIYGITPKAADTLNDRKFRILARLSEELPYTEVTLNDRLKKLCGADGYTCEVKHGIYTLKVRIELIVKAQYEAVEHLLKRITPANLVIDLDLRYNQHLTLAPYTHTHLATYTQQKLRDEVIS